MAPKTASVKLVVPLSGTAKRMAAGSPAAMRAWATSAGICRQRRSLHGRAAGCSGLLAELFQFIFGAENRGKRGRGDPFWLPVAL